MKKIIFHRPARDIFVLCYPHITTPQFIFNVLCGKGFLIMAILTSNKTNVDDDKA